jgi:hypothetical protein
MRGIAAALTAVLLGMGAMACDEEAMEPDQQTPVILQQGVNVYLVVSGANLANGTEFWAEAKVRVVQEEQTPTAFVANLRYDPESVEFIGMLPMDDEVLRATNPDFEPNAIRVAGAAADGLGTETLFGVRMRVKRADYLAGLAVELDELDILEQDFAEVSSDAAVKADAVENGTPVLEKR